MAKSLFKVAKELNVGTHTIVEYLTNSGFEIEDKPNAKIQPDMYDELLKEFQSSVQIKEQADQLVIGTRPADKEGEKEGPSPGLTTKETPADKPKEEQTAEPKSAPEPAEAKEEKPKEEKKEEEVTPRPKAKLKVVGKIDLKKKAKGKKDEEAPTPEKEEKGISPAAESPVEEKAEPEKKKTAKAKTTKKKEEEKPVAEPEAKDSQEEEAEAAEETTEAQKSEMVRTKTPELRGLKIQGKIDLEKVDTGRKKKKEEDKKPKPVASSSEDSGTKRKRRRRRVPVEGKGRRSDRKGGRRGRNDDVKEVSQKEIDEKIKATMARLSGGGKKKRQKIRRESRKDRREASEALENQQAEESSKLLVTEFISVQELANMMDVDATEVIMTCMNLGVIVSINQRLDAEIIELLAEEYGHDVEFVSAEEQVEEEEEVVDDPEDLEPRAPIVTVMGHVDHGKTSLLDFIREANVASGEAGGITQHIGAYEVEVGDESKKITFLDTPGHEAFTAMRARGAKVTDISVVIIAADDNVMPQTKEAISHSQAAGVPMVFAINKVDKDGADPERIKQELANMNLLVEDWGGEYQSQDISAKTGLGIEELLEKILLQAEMLELKANPDRPAVGTVLEASLEKGRGYVTKSLIQTGTLKIGDPVLAGEFQGKVKAMFNERGKRIKQAGPSTPVLILGLDGAPPAGERLKVMETEQEAKQLASKRAQIAREQANRATKRISLDDIGRRIALGTFQELNLIVKGDVDGSVEALSDSLIKESIETIQVNVIHKGVGQIVDSDVMLASASDAIIIGFQVRPSLSARKLAEQEGVEIKTYSVIYDAIEEIKAAVEGMLEPTKEEKITANLEVREVYKISRVGTVAGCYVQDGKINRNNFVRIIRDGIVVYPTKEGANAELASLKRFKDDVKEVRSGMECGCSIKNFNDIKVGDVIEAYEIEEVRQTLS